jgi:hypothetical protein
VRQSPVGKNMETEAKGTGQDSEYLVRAVVNCRLRELAVALSVTCS